MSDYQLYAIDVEPAGDTAVWAHPIDVHFSTTSLQGWPRVLVEVWSEDTFGRHVLAGYGAAFVPCAPGEHSVEVVTLRPVGSTSAQLKAWFLGTTAQLEHPSLALVDADRVDLSTETAGVVHMQVNVVLRGFRTKGTAFGSRQFLH